MQGETTQVTDTTGGIALGQGSVTPLALASPSRGDKTLALLAFAVSAVFFSVLAPFAQEPLPPAPAFIALYQGALVTNDMITAAMLFGHYRVSRLRALFMLACGYLFAALIAAIHLLTFPGLFSEGGLLGAGAQTTAWLYMIWHAVFPLFVVGYVMSQETTLSRRIAPVAGGSVVLLVAVIAWSTTAGEALLPSIMRGHGYASRYHIVATLVWLCSLVALVSVWRKKPRTVLDLWLLVVMFSWLCDIALAAVLNAGRFDLGFYAGRIYGLLAASFVLIVLLVETTWLQAKVAAMAADVAAERRRAALAENANFLLGLNERFRTAGNPLEIQYLSAQETGLQFAADRVGFAEVEDGGAMAVAAGYGQGEPGDGQLYRCADYGAAVLSQLESGHSVYQTGHDVHDAPFPAGTTSTREPRVQATAHIPLITSRRLAAIMFVHYTQPHDWSSDEIALLTVIAERTWAAVERRRASAAEAIAVERYERQVRLFESVASTTLDFLCVLDRQGRFQFANRQLLQVWGMSLEDVVGKNCLELGHPERHHEMHMREIAQVIETKQPVKHEAPFEAPRTGVSGIYEYIFVPVLGPDGEVELIACTTRDVTERKEVERRKDEFVATLSHELRNPLVAIRSALDLMSRPDTADRVLRTASNIMDQQVSQLVRLVNDLGEASRVTSGTFSSHKVPVELGTIVESAVETARPSIHSAGHKLHAALPDGRIVVLGDAVRLRQVLANLLNNAASFTKPGGAITVELRREARSALISITDTGQGIASDELPRLFQMFTRGHRTTGAGHTGLGIGLAVVRSLVEMHGGTVGAQSAGPGKGSCFTVRLPLSTEQTYEPADVMHRG